MSSFRLQIVTPDGSVYDGNAEQVTVRTVSGDVSILPHHINFVSALGMGEARITIDGTVRRAACIGGIISVSDEGVSLVPTTFEWAEDIDIDRAKKAEDVARGRLSSGSSDIVMAEAKLKRSLVRQSVASRR